MANTLITPQNIAREALRNLSNVLKIAKKVNREYRDEWLGTKPGDTVRIRKPVKFTARSGATYTAQDVLEGNTSIVINQQKGVDFEFTTKDLTLTIDEFGKRYLKPAMITLAHDIDAALFANYTSIYQFVGTPGTPPATFAAWAVAPTLLDEQAVPEDDRVGFVSPSVNYGLASTIAGLYIGSNNRDALERAKVGELAGVDVYKAQGVPTHTMGPRGGTPLVNGASQSVTYAASMSTWTQSLITDGWTAAAATRVAVGDTFTFSTVFAVNPRTLVSTGRLQTFTVMPGSAVASDGSGNLTLLISPPMIVSGAYQTVTNAPADNLALTMIGTASTAYLQNLVFHPDALALVTVPMELPDGVEFKASESYDGLSIRVIRQYAISDDVNKCRLDVLYGTKLVYPELAVRLTS